MQLLFFCTILGILGLCAIVLSSPYDVPHYLPEALMILCEHSHDPDPIHVSFSIIALVLVTKVLTFHRNQLNNVYLSFVVLTMIHGMYTKTNSPSGNF